VTGVQTCALPICVALGNNISHHYLSVFYDHVSNFDDTNVIAEKFNLYFDQALNSTFYKKHGGKA
jgi:hypothetical protein